MRLLCSFHFMVKLDSDLVRIAADSFNPGSLAKPARASVYCFGLRNGMAVEHSHEESGFSHQF